MAIKLLEQGDVVALGVDNSTGERGFLSVWINQTGHTSIKGEVVTVSLSTSGEAILQTNEYDAMGVVQQELVPTGSPMWVWMNGSVCQVLVKDGVAPIAGSFLICADVDGRADNVESVDKGGLPAADTHFKECGHVMASPVASSNVLVLAVLHFN